MHSYNYCTNRYNIIDMKENILLPDVEAFAHDVDPKSDNLRGRPCDDADPLNNCTVLASFIYIYI